MRDLDRSERRLKVGREGKFHNAEPPEGGRLVCFALRLCATMAYG